MKNVVLLSVLALNTTAALADVVTFKGTGTYQMSEFDTQASAFAMAEKKALVNIAEQVKDQVLSIRSVDSNGFYSRASWLVDSALVERLEADKSIGLCESGDGICTTVNLKAMLDTSKSEKHLKVIYANRQLLTKLETLIASEKEYERQILAGYPVDVAYEKSKQSKRHALLELIGKQTSVKAAGTVEEGVVAGAITRTTEADKAGLLNESERTSYLAMLNAIKSELSVEVIDQKSIIHSDGTGGIRLTVKFKSKHLTETINWVAEKLGVPQGKWQNYKDTRDSWVNGRWVYPLTMINYGELKDSVTLLKYKESVLYPEKVAIQYGVDVGHKRPKSNSSPSYGLDLDKLSLVEKFGAHSVCVDFYLQPGKEIRRCVVGGNQNSVKDPTLGSWDVDVPYLWFAENGSSANVFIPLEKSILRDPKAMRTFKYQYKVTVQKNPIGA